MLATAVHPLSPQAREALGLEIFAGLRGDERYPIPTAGDHAYEQIWLQLITGERKPGERLSDAELALQLGVSRTPVRQALHRLAQDELVRFDPRRGFSVRTFTAADVHELYDVRGALEVLALRLAAPRLRADELRTHLSQLEAVRAALAERPVVPFMQHDFRLHDLLIRASRNGRLIRLLAALRGQVGVFQIRDAASGHPRRMEAALDYHERIIHALLDGRIDQALTCLADHIADAKAGVLADLFAAKEVTP